MVEAEASNDVAEPGAAGRDRECLAWGAVSGAKAIPAGPLPTGDVPVTASSESELR